PGHRLHDDREPPQRVDLAPDARLPPARQRPAQGRFQRRLARRAGRRSPPMSTRYDASIATPHDDWERERLAAAEAAAALGARVALVERHLLGGTCFNTGCVPSKSLLRSAAVYAQMRDAARYGAQAPAAITVDFAAAMARLRRIRSHLAGTVSVRHLVQRGVDVFFGNAQFTGPDSLAVNGQPLRFRRAMVATGARPQIPDIPGLKQAGFL